MSSSAPSAAPDATRGAAAAGGATAVEAVLHQLQQLQETHARLQARHAALEAEVEAAPARRRDANAPADFSAPGTDSKVLAPAL